MTSRPIWAIEVRCKDGDRPPLSVEIAAHSALEALASATAELAASALDPAKLDAEWPAGVTVTTMPSSPLSELFLIECRCGGNWGQVDRRRALWILKDAIAQYHGPGRCEGRWPENRPSAPESVNAVGAAIRQRREAAGISQA